MKANKTNAVDKNTPEYLLRQMEGARKSLLMIVVFTLINVVLLLIGVEDYLFGDGVTYMLFSASVPYYLAMFGVTFDWGIGTYTAIALVIGAVILGLYLLCWYMSKRRAGWLVAALVMFLLDTLVLVAMSVWMESLVNDILDLLFHGWAVVELIQAISANRKLNKMIESFAAYEEQYLENRGPEF